MPSEKVGVNIYINRAVSSLLSSFPVDVSRKRMSLSRVQDKEMLAPPFYYSRTKKAMEFLIFVNNYKF